MIFDIIQKKAGWILSGFVLVVLIIIIFIFEGTYSSGDGIQHYLISKYSWKHPELFLHHWGKPFFILISSPFSQFGLKGITIFNVLCAVLSALFCYLIACKMNIPYAWLTIIFLCFTPIYFCVTQSGLTEPFFGCVLIASIYLILLEKYIISSLLISFIPFIRAEGYFVLLLFALFFLLKKKKIPILFLAAGNVIYSVVGYFYYHDLLWIINQDPYKSSLINKNSGEFWLFVNSAQSIFGTPLLILFISGCLYYLLPKSIFKKIKEKSKYLKEEIILIFGIFFICLFVISLYVWWRGLDGLSGIKRVAAEIMPLSAIICLRGYNFISSVFVNLKFLKIFLLIVVIIWILYIPFRRYSDKLYKLDEQEKTILTAVNWFKSSKYFGNKVYYCHPFIAYVLNVDPFDKSKIGTQNELRDNLQKKMSKNEVIIWDSWFCQREFGITLDKFNNSDFYFLYKFKSNCVIYNVDTTKIYFEIYFFQHK